MFPASHIKQVMMLTAGLCLLAAINPASANLWDSLNKGFDETTENSNRKETPYGTLTKIHAASLMEAINQFRKITLLLSDNEKHQYFSELSARLQETHPEIQWIAWAPFSPGDTTKESPTQATFKSLVHQHFPDQKPFGLKDELTDIYLSEIETSLQTNTPVLAPLPDNTSEQATGSLLLIAPYQKPTRQPQPYLWQAFRGVHVFQLNFRRFFSQINQHHAEKPPRLAVYLVRENAQKMIILGDASARQSDNKSYDESIRLFDNQIEVRVDASGTSMQPHEWITWFLASLFAFILTAGLLWIRAQSGASRTIQKTLHTLEKKMHEKEQTLALLTEETDDLWAIWDDNRNTIHYFGDWPRVTGYKCDELPREVEALKSYLDPKYLDKLQSRIISIYCKKADRFCERIRIKTANDTYLWVEIKGRAFCRADQKNSLLVFHGRDISQKILDEIKIQKFSTYKDLILQNAPIAIIECDRHGTITLWNDFATQLFDLSQREAIGRHINEIFPLEEQKKLIREALNEAYNHQEPRTFSLKTISGKHEKKQLKTHWQSIPMTHRSDFASLDSFRSCLFLIADQTSNYQAIQQLKDLSTRFNKLIHHMPCVYFRRLPDSNYTLLEVNAKICALSGYSPEELMMNKSLAYKNIIHPDDLEIIEHEIEQALGNNSGWQVSYRLMHREGHLVPVVETGFPVRKDNLISYLESFVTNQETGHLTENHSTFLASQPEINLESSFVKAMTNHYPGIQSLNNQLYFMVDAGVPQTIELPAHDFEMLARNLVHHALLSSGDLPVSIHISGKIRASKAEIEILVADAGPCLSPELLRHILEENLEDREEALSHETHDEEALMPIELFNACNLCHQNGWQFEIFSAPKEGNTVSVRLQALLPETSRGESPFSLQKLFRGKHFIIVTDHLMYSSHLAARLEALHANALIFTHEEFLKQRNLRGDLLLIDSPSGTVIPLNKTVANHQMDYIFLVPQGLLAQCQLQYPDLQFVATPLTLKHLANLFSDNESRKDQPGTGS